MTASQVIAGLNKRPALFFISRASSDTDIAQRIAQILVDAGHQVILQQWDFLNQSFLQKMRDALRKADRVIALLSPAYLKSDHCEAEWQNAIVADPLNKRGRLIVMRVAECQPEGLLTSFAYWDLLPILGDAEKLREVVLASVRTGRQNDPLPAVARYFEAANPILHLPDRTRPRRAFGKKIFISYRRSDAQHIAGRVYDNLELEFGSDEIFFDVNTIPYGVDFRKYISDFVKASVVVIAVISTSWKTFFKKNWFISRHKFDFVQVELELAFENSVPVLPILVDDTPMPRENDLPKAISSIAYINAARLRGGKDFRNDMAGIISTIKDLRVIAADAKELPYSPIL